MGLTAFKVTYPSFAICRVLAAAQVGLAALEATKASLFIVFSPMPRWGSPPSKLPKIAICRAPAAQVGLAAPEVTKVSLCIVFPPLRRWGSPPWKVPKYVSVFCDRSAHVAPLTELASQSLDVLVHPTRVTCPGQHVHSRPRSCQACHATIKLSCEMDPRPPQPDFCYGFRWDPIGCVFGIQSRGSDDTPLRPLNGRFSRDHETGRRQTS